jgi:hypothetical protein
MIIELQNEIKMDIFPGGMGKAFSGVKRGENEKCENKMKLLKIVKSCGSMAFVVM